MICDSNLLFNVAAVYDNRDNPIRGCVCVCVHMSMRERGMDWRSVTASKSEHTLFKLIVCGGNVVASNSSADRLNIYLHYDTKMYMYFYYIFLFIPFNKKKYNKNEHFTREHFLT